MFSVYSLSNTSKAAMEMPWDVPEPQYFAEDMLQFSDLSPPLLEKNEPTPPVLHGKGILKFQP